MSREEKLLERLRDFSRDKNWEFDELCRLLQRLGFEMRISGSHHFFRRAGMSDIVNLQPHQSRAKPYQVRQVREVLSANGLL
jgi:predicted RNA binding protein YcfA (HicA-like mRNA interferase family)